MDQLKQAERNASALVDAARKERVERMKQAKIDAEAQISAYRAEMESAFQTKAKKVNINQIFLIIINKIFFLK
jgi:V-type H+-transporting ATPase subunit G